MTRAKKQHFVPRFYLENFSDSDGLVWTYDFQAGSVIALPATETGKESNFYSPMNSGEGRQDEIEGMLSIIESNAAPLFEKMIRGEPFSGTDREHMAIFFSAQYFRSPTMIESAANLNGQMADMVSQTLASNKKVLRQAMERIGKNPTDHDIQEMQEFMLDPGRKTITTVKHSGLMAMAAIPKAAEIIFDLNWTVLYSPNQHFITSDSPVAKAYDPRSYHATYGDGGFLNKTIHISLPLTPNHLVLMEWDDGVNGIVSIEKPAARMFNRLRASWANRFLYADRKDPGIKKLGEKHKVGTSKQRLVISRETSPVFVKRKL